MSIIKRIASIILLIPLLEIGYIIGLLQFNEGYNPIEPSIDTVFTLDYSEEKFDQIRIGMDSVTVVKIIGKPFGVQKYTEQNTLWYYSHDGKCSWHDFAWLSREIIFDAKGKVSKKKKIICYD